MSIPSLYHVYFIYVVNSHMQSVANLFYFSCEGVFDTELRFNLNIISASDTPSQKYENDLATDCT